MGGIGGDVDDHARTLAFEQRDAAAHEVESAADIDTETGLPVVERQVLGRSEPQDAGGVDENVDASGLAKYAAAYFVDLAGIGDVERDKLRFGIAIPACVGRGEVEPDHPGALSAKAFGHTSPDAAGRARDQHALAGEIP